MSEEVLVERRGSILLITINRPEARNAVNMAVTVGVAEAVDRLDADDSLHAAVLTGAGGTFCSGMDLKAFARGERPAVPGRGMCGITQTPPRKPLIAAVEGWALAGGFEVMLACDMVVAARTAKFGLPEVKRGLVAGAGGAIQVPRRIPLALANELLLLGEPIDAERAAQMGLVNRVCEEGQAAEVACQLAEQISLNGPLAVIATKQVARESGDWTLEEAWKKSAAIIAPVMASDQAMEGAMAFAEKRPPSWVTAAR